MHPRGLGFCLLGGGGVGGKGGAGLLLTRKGRKVA
jgi:hypothetical protein